MIEEWLTNEVCSIRCQLGCYKYIFIFIPASLYDSLYEYSQLSRQGLTYVPTKQQPCDAGGGDVYRRRPRNTHSHLVRCQSVPFPGHVCQGMAVVRGSKHAVTALVKSCNLPTLLWIGAAGACPTLLGACLHIGQLSDVSLNPSTHICVAVLLACTHIFSYSVLCGRYQGE